MTVGFKCGIEIHQQLNTHKLFWADDFLGNINKKVIIKKFNT